MAYSRGYQQQQQQAPSPWASGAPPYLQQQQMPQHHPVMPQHQLQGYGHPDFPAPGPYGQPGPAASYSSPMSYGRTPYVPMARTGSFGGAPAMQQQQRQSVQPGNRSNFGAGGMNKRQAIGFDGPSGVKRNRPINGNHPSANNNIGRNIGGNRGNNVPNQSKNLNAANNNRNVQANGTNQANNSGINTNKNRNQQNKVQNQQNKVQNQQNKQQNQQNKQQNQQNKQKAKGGNDTQNDPSSIHIVTFNGFMCKLCTAYMKDKAARAEHLKDEGHKLRAAEFEAASQKVVPVPEAAATPAASATVAPAPVPAVEADAEPSDPVTAVTLIEDKSPAKETAPVSSVPVPSSPVVVKAEKTCACSHTTA